MRWPALRHFRLAMLSVALGCAGDASAGRPAVTGPPAAEVAAGIRAALPVDRGSRILALDATLCLRCKNVGLLIRRLRMDGAVGLVIVAPAKDVVAVREYLAREKVASVPVFPLDAAHFAGPVFTDSLLVTWIAADGEPRHLVANDGELLLQAIRTSADRLEAVPADRSPQKGGERR